MRNLGGHHYCDNTPPRVADIRVANSDVDATPHLDFDNSFASFSFSRVYQLEEVDTAISDTDDMFFDGTDSIDPRVMSLFDLRVPDFALTHDDLGALDLYCFSPSTSLRRF